MGRRYPRTSPEEIAKELMEGNPPEEPSHFEWAGGTYVGDFFYSSIQSTIKAHWGKKYPYEVFHKVCRILEQNGYWVHS